MLDWVAILLVSTGAFFFIAGTLGLLRLRDSFSRLHAITKVDTLGLGLVVLGLALQAESVAAGLKLVVIWLFAALASATAGYLFAQHGLGARDSLNHDG